MKKKPEIQTFNDGVLNVYSIKHNDDGEDTLTLKHAGLRYKERTVGMGRFYTAMQENIKISLVVRIALHKNISSQDVVVIDGVQYAIRQLQHPVDVKPACWDLSLEEVVQVYDIT